MTTLLLAISAGFFLAPAWMPAILVWIVKPGPHDRAEVAIVGMVVGFILALFGIFPLGMVADLTGHGWA